VLQKDREDILQLVDLSYRIGRALREDPILSNPTLVRRIQKLGDYLGAVLSITETLASPHIFNLRAAIRFAEVSLYLHAFNNFEYLTKYSIGQTPSTSRTSGSKKSREHYQRLRPR